MLYTIQIIIYFYINFTGFLSVSNLNILPFTSIPQEADVSKQWGSSSEQNLYSKN